jgi:uncharacterized integral membrane protein
VLLRCQESQDQPIPISSLRCQLGGVRLQESVPTLLLPSIAATTMRQLNFLLIFSFGLAMVMFTLENTVATTVNFIPGVSLTLPLAAMLLLVGGIGATAAWIFAVWTGVVRKVETLQDTSELESQQVRIQELESDLERYRATVDAQLAMLPAAGGSSGSTAIEDPR